MTTFDTTYVREFSPDYQNVFADSGNDAWSLFAKRKYVVGAMMVTLAIISGIFVLAGGAALISSRTHDVTAGSYVFDALAFAYYVSMIVVGVYGLADSVRTVHPDFKMTFGGVMGMIGLSLLVGLIIDAGFLLLVIPGIWLAIKLSQTIFAYFLRPGRNALQQSWSATEGHFWATFLFYILISIFVGFGMMLPYFLVILAIVAFPLSAVLLVPFLFGIWSFMQYFNALVHVRWTEALLRAHEMRMDPAIRYPA